MKMKTVSHIMGMFKSNSPGNTGMKNAGGATGYKKISAEAAKSMIDAGQVIILDVRTPAEYAGGHLVNAILVPVREIETQAPVRMAEKNGKIIVYCSSGSRSAKAAKTLLKMGYTNVYDMGGIANWPYKTTK